MIQNAKYFKCVKILLALLKFKNEKKNILFNATENTEKRHTNLFFQALLRVLIVPTVQKGFSSRFMAEN